MAEITRAEVEKIAHLARLKLREEEIERFSHQLKAIVAYMGRLREVNVEGVEPFLSAAVEENVFREDVPHTSLSREGALANAPEAADGFFLVPPMQGSEVE